MFGELICIIVNISGMFFVEVVSYKKCANLSATLKLPGRKLTTRYRLFLFYDEI